MDGTGTLIYYAIILAKTKALKRKLSSCIHMDKIYQDLCKETESLAAERDEYEALFQLRMPSYGYSDWIKRVNLVLKDFDELKIMYTKERKRSSLFSSRSRFSNIVRNTASQVDALMYGDLRFIPNRFSLLLRVVEQRTPNITHISTLETPLQQTLGWLCDDNVRGIRINGFVGSGKTTIMQNLNNHVEVAKMFDLVIWVDAAISIDGTMMHMSLSDIQQSIVQRLELNIKVATPLDLVASTIRQTLKDIKFLLLLDNLNQDLNLDLIGIPSNSGSKIVFTTRLQHICSSFATRQAYVATLNKQEAINMFKSVLTRPELLRAPYNYPIVPYIVKWCGYNPLVISIAAHFFSHWNLTRSWAYGLLTLRKNPERIGTCTSSMILRLIYKLKRCYDWYDVTQNTGCWYTALDMIDRETQKDWPDETCELVTSGPDIWNYLKIVKLPEENTSHR